MAVCETMIVVICVLIGDGGDGWKNRLLLGAIDAFEKNLQDFGTQCCLFESRIRCKTVKLEVKYVVKWQKCYYK